MKVIEMGNLGMAEGMTGVLIEATKSELQKMANLLYEDVKIVSANPKLASPNEDQKYLQMFEAQVKRSGIIDGNLRKDPERKYSAKEVEKIVDFLLDGFEKLPSIRKTRKPTKEQQADDNKGTEL